MFPPTPFKWVPMPEEVRPLASYRHHSMPSLPRGVTPFPIEHEPAGGGSPILHVPSRLYALAGGEERRTLARWAETGGRPALATWSIPETAVVTVTVREMRWPITWDQHGYPATYKTGRMIQDHVGFKTAAWPDQALYDSYSSAWPDDWLRPSAVTDPQSVEEEHVNPTRSWRASGQPPEEWTMTVPIPTGTALTGPSDQETIEANYVTAFNAPILKRYADGTTVTEGSVTAKRLRWEYDWDEWVVSQPMFTLFANVIAFMAGTDMGFENPEWLDYPEGGDTIYPWDPLPSLGGTASLVPDPYTAKHGHFLALGVGGSPPGVTAGVRAFRWYIEGFADWVPDIFHTRFGVDYPVRRLDEDQGDPVKFLFSPAGGVRPLWFVQTGIVGLPDRPAPVESFEEEPLPIPSVPEGEFAYAQVSGVHYYRADAARFQMTALDSDQYPVHDPWPTTQRASSAGVDTAMSVAVEFLQAGDGLLYDGPHGTLPRPHSGQAGVFLGRGITATGQYAVDAVTSRDGVLAALVQDGNLTVWRAGGEVLWDRPLAESLPPDLLAELDLDIEPVLSYRFAAPGWPHAVGALHVGGAALVFAAWHAADRRYRLEDGVPPITVTLQALQAFEGFYERWDTVLWPE